MVTYTDSGVNRTKKLLPNGNYHVISIAMNTIMNTIETTVETTVETTIQVTWLWLKWRKHSDRSQLFQLL
jgi:hypothetical protein